MKGKKIENGTKRKMHYHSFTSCCNPLQAIKPVSMMFEVSFGEVIGLGLPCCSLSKCPNPLGTIPETRITSVNTKDIYQST